MYDPLGYRPHSSSDPAYAGPPSPRGKVLVRRRESVRHGGTQGPALHYGAECGGEIGLRWFLQAVVAAYINYPARKFRAGFLHVSYGLSGISAYSFLVTSLLGIPQASASRSLMYSLITPLEIDIQALAKFSGCSSNSSSIHCAKRSA